jgi:hypothetical protein
MGLLDKTNPCATRESVIRHALIFGSLVAAGYPIACIWSEVLRDNWFLFPVAVVFGALMGALMEWQIDDGLEIYWVVKEAEEEFNVTIADAIVDKIESVGDLFNAVLTELRANQPKLFEDDPEYSDEIWEKLKALLVHQLGLKPEQVVKAARFYQDLGL